MKKLILFVFGLVFAISAFGLERCSYMQPMNGAYCLINGNESNALFELPIIENGIDIKVKSFSCDITTNYKSNINGFAVRLTMFTQNAILYHPTNIYANNLFIEKNITYIAKSSGGKITDIYEKGSLLIINYGCSPYDPDCKHKSDPNWHGDDLIVSCRYLTN